MAYLRTISIAGQVGAQIQWSLAFLAALASLLTLAILVSVVGKPRRERDDEDEVLPAPSRTERRHAPVAGRSRYSGPTESRRRPRLSPQVT